MNDVDKAEAETGDASEFSVSIIITIENEPCQLPGNIRASSIDTPPQDISIELRSDPMEAVSSIASAVFSP